MSDPRGEGVIGTGRPPGGRRAATAALGAVVIWSTNALAAGAALDRLTLIQVLALQFGAAAMALGVVRHRRVARGRRDGVSRRRLTARGVAVAVVGLTGTIALQYLAFATAPLVAANAVAYAWPLLVAAWVALVAHPRASRAPLALALAGFAGVLLIFVQRGGGGDGATAPLPGYLAALGSALAMAWYTLAVGRVAASRADLLFVATLAGAVVTVPVAVAQGDSWSLGAAIWLGLYAGVGPMAGGTHSGPTPCLIPPARNSPRSHMRRHCCRRSSCWPRASA